MRLLYILHRADIWWQETVSRLIAVGLTFGFFHY
jgi:hypothetical protein